MYLIIYISLLSIALLRLDLASTLSMYQAVVRTYISLIDFFLVTRFIVPCLIPKVRYYLTVHISRHFIDLRSPTTASGGVTWGIEPLIPCLLQSNSVCGESMYTYVRFRPNIYRVYSLISFA